ncbi:uncharacterized protein LOC115620881 [Scaptodrosophila lebanonensis]|uniref:Uncharacterized protein LOC115620881 n=1 Tax=Drosophila lebanonensis TaxID=7225 RepID=A0A6J2T2K8_DROLE|nr:uncharacterized protein LOC115620881 [Scaptodrosophila lebanonensis]
MPTGANCKAGVCDCADGHNYVRGKCRPLNGLREPCETDLDCYFGYDRASVSCQDRVCACANGYYNRYGNICRRKSMEWDDACVVDADCEELSAGAKCVSLKCNYVDEVTTPGAEHTTEDTTPEDNTPEDNTPEDNETTAATNTETTTEEAATTSALKRQIARVFVHAPPKYQNDAAIQANPPLTNGGGSEHTVATPPLAAPRRLREIAVQTSIEGYELRDFGRTVRNVGTATASTSTSSRRTSKNYRRRRLPSIFRFDDEDNKTYSTLGSSRDDDDGDNKQYGSSCTENGKSCSGLPHSICANKICLCQQGYYARNGKCFAELGEIAESTDECEYEFEELSKKCICQKNYFYERDLRNCRKPIQYHLSCTSNSQCSPFGAAFCHPDIPRRCTCEEYAQYDTLTQLCEYKQGLGAECESNDGCPVANSVCSNRLCVCKESFFEKEGACVAGVGADCAENDDCALENTICQEQSTSNSAKESEDQERSCQCRKGYVHFKDECLKEAEELEEDCVEDEQCKPLLASCSAERKCSCTDEQHAKNGRCETKRNLGEACTKATECFVEKDPETVECRNSVCQCKFGYQAETEKRQCIRVMPNKKNSSGRPSALKIITFILIGSAFLITSAAIKQAYY